MKRRQVTFLMEDPDASGPRLAAERRSRMTARVTLAIAWAVLAAALYLMATNNPPDRCWTPATDGPATIYTPETP